MEQKTNNAALRIDKKCIRDGLSKEEVALKSKRISESLYEIIKALGVRDILCFYPLGNEVNLLELYNKLLSESYNLFFPKTEGVYMSFYGVSSLKEDFTEGNFHVMEPSKNENAFCKNTGICITPGLVFDEQGNRVGFGKGYYDRYFAEHMKLIKIGVAYEFQIVDEIIPSEYDVPLEYIVTENSILRRE